MPPAWLLPEYVEDILPPYARQAEGLRRRLLDLFDSYGYDLVYPPLVEYLDSLLTGAARDLDLKTFKVVDGLSGRMLGVRADMTPQAARIDAHLINHEGATRLCYAGPVLRTKPAGFLTSREPFQLGAELERFATGQESGWLGPQHRAGITQAGRTFMIDQVGIDTRGLRRHVGAHAKHTAGQAIDHLEGFQIKITRRAGEQRI